MYNLYNWFGISPYSIYMVIIKNNHEKYKSNIASFTYRNGAKSVRRVS